MWFRRKPPATDGADGRPGSISQELLDRVRLIELRARRLVNDLFLGEYQAVFRGRGVEFDELRPYVPGDDVRSIDWKAFARTGDAMIRRYREDRDLTVMFVVDVSASQRAGAAARSKADLAAEVSAVLALAAIRNKDRVGLLLFAGEPERYLRPSAGSTHVLRVIREILWARPQSLHTDIGRALEYLVGIQRRRATVFLVSDFLTADYAPQLRAAARRHDIIAVRVREPVDSSIAAAGILSLSDPETGAVVEVDTSDPAVRHAYEAAVASMDADRKRLFGELHVDEIQLLVGQDYIPALLRFFRGRVVAA
ncbi:MAG: DUF58 domain-containing protein [Dehalococcoidia bacterium]